MPLPDGAFGMIGDGISNLFKIGGAAIASKSLKKLSNEQRGLSAMYGKKADEAWKDYETPDSLKKAANEAEMESKGKSSIQSYMEESADIGLNRHLEGVRDYATSGATGLAAVQSAVRTSNEAKRGAAIAGKQDMDGKKDVSRAMQMELASSEDKAWEMNHNQKYLQNLQLSQDNLAAAQGNENARAMTWANLG